MMQNSLLIINYNYSEHGFTRNFLYEIYSPYFKKVVFYSDLDNSAANSNTQGSHKLNKIDTHMGYFSYRAVIDFFSKNSVSDYDGVFFLMDDCIVNPLAIKSLKNDKIIFPGNTFSSSSSFDEIKKNALRDFKQIKKDNWKWWPTKNGISACKKTGYNNFARGFSDYFYIPKHKVSQFLEHAHIMSKNEVFLEIAVPTIILIISNKDTFQNGIAGEIRLWRENRKQVEDPKYIKQSFKTASSIHPIKLGIHSHLLALGSAPKEIFPKNFKKIKLEYQKLVKFNQRRIIDQQKKFIVITTINEKTKAVIDFEKKKNWHVVIVGDKKSKNIEDSDNLTFLSVEKQKKLGYEIVKKLPFNHYCRKNIGYLYAIEQGADIVYETDDDNIPLKDWSFPKFSATSQLTSENKYVNVYKHFSNEAIWPRGFPIANLHDNPPSIFKQDSKVAIWQGLADNDPDIDAIHRLVYAKMITFDKKNPVAIQRGKYCPFNTQNTLWSSPALPYLYLPSTVSFRFTDILKSYVAQRLIWDQEQLLGFTKATVYQERNEHDLMKDFKDEVEMYLDTKKIIDLLDQISLSGSPLQRLEEIYKQLAKHGFVKKEELTLVRAWCKDYRRITKK